MIYRYYLDGNLIPEAQGWDKFVTSIKRDKTNNGISVAQDFTLTFGASVYNYFQGKLNSDGYCYEAELLIEYSVDNGNNWLTFHNGIIYLSDIRFDEKRKECTARIQDNSFYAYINNNVNVATFLFAGKSKNGVLINTPTMQYLQCSEVATNNPFPINTTAGYEYKSFLVYDVFKYLIAFMTDNKVDFKSTTFDVGGIYHDYVITTGYVLRYSILNGYNGAVNPAGINQQQFESSWQQISFKNFYDEMFKRFNLVWWVETIAGVPTFRIEAESDSRTTSINNLATNYIDELFSQVDADSLYSNVKISNGAVTEQSPFTIFPNRLNLLGFRDEEYSVTGQCNLDNTLSLETNYIHDTNTIQDCLEQGWATAFTDEYDNEIFIINAIDDAVGTCNAVQTNWLQVAPPNYFNEQLNNYNIVSRFFNGIPTALAQYLGSGDNRFKAYQMPMGSYFVGFNEPVIATDITSPNGFDAGGNYNTLLSRFVAPAEGIYSFRAQVGNIGSTAPAGYIDTGNLLGISIYNSLGVLQNQIGTPYVSQGTGLFFNVGFEFGSVYLGVGWYVQAFYNWSNFAPTIIDQYNDYFYWECYNAASDGKINYVDIDKLPINTFQFKVPMTLDELKLIEGNLPALIPFQRYGDSNTRYGWIKTMRYNHKDNIAEFNLITSKGTINGN